MTFDFRQKSCKALGSIVHDWDVGITFSFDNVEERETFAMCFQILVSAQQFAVSTMKQACFCIFDVGLVFLRQSSRHWKQLRLASLCGN
jgi:hypothetical protein